MDPLMLFGCIFLSFLFYQMTLFTWKIFQGFILTKLGFVKDLTKYGDWVVVTGATDGIGKEYAKQLAEKGFNIVLMSRTKSKLITVANEIEEVFKVETKIFVYDFSLLTDYSDIEKEISKLDIGILVNNVGMAYGSLEPLHESDMNRVCGIINCNIFPDVMLTNIVLKGMIKRKRGVIIHISSGSILINAPFMSIYPATKQFIEKFATCMRCENYGNVDHQLVIPMYVASNMSRMKPMFTIPTAEEYVRQAIRTIGVLDRTCGYWSHEFLYVLVYLTPNFIVQYLFVLFRQRRLKNQ